MKKRSVFISIAVLITCCGAKAQAKHITVPMQPAAWQFDSSKTEFVLYKSVPCVKGRNNAFYQVFLKDQVFTAGTIEFDVELSGMGFPGINFRMSADNKNGEHFYIRSFGPVSSATRTTLQYAEIKDGVSMWDLADEYQAGAVIHQDSWNHVKLVISGKQMKAYVNDMHKPALVVPELESSQRSGGISLSGNVIFANLVIKPGVVESLDSSAALNVIANDTRYLRKWEVAPAIRFPFGKEIIISLPSMYGTLTKADLPDSSAKWQPLIANNRGIVNVYNLFGATENDARRLTWLRTTIIADKEQERTLQLGFSDEAWVFINGQIVYAGKNYFGTPQAKNDGRCTIENANFTLPLKQGKNEIMIALANYFYGWGIIARLDDTAGLSLSE